MNRKELQDLSNIRLREAKALLGLGLHDGAYYLAGYAVECALKACIAKSTRKYEFPDKKKVDSSYSHSLRELLRVAGLDEARDEAAMLDAEFRENWRIVQSWSEQSRYRRHRPDAARELLDAIMSPRSGVARWIKRHW